MQVYKAPLKDYKFLIRDFIKSDLFEKVLITATIGPFGIILFEENLDNNSLHPPQAGRIPYAASVNPI